MENESRITAEGSSARTAYAFLRPLPSQRGVGSSSPAAASVGAMVPARDEMLRRLFPARNPAIGDSEGSLSVAGTVLGHFQLQERIGRGGMGAVFRAVDLRLDRIVALKVLSPEQSHDPASVQRFQNEARAAAKLDHDNIAQVYFIGEDQGLQFIAFEFITGTNIRELLARLGTLPIPEAVSYTLQVAEALRSTAAVGVVHRDIKPSNIIIEPTGRVTLVDLGLARQSGGVGEDLTVAGTTLGTFDYISPEQAVDPRKVDVRSDIYSLGCTVYHMVTGEPPYPSNSMFQKVVDHHGAVAPDPRLKNPRVSPQLAAVIRKMMASDPDDRYTSPEALIRDLQPIARNLGVRQVQAGWDVRSAAGRDWLREYRGWIAAAAFLVLLGLGINKLPTAPETPLELGASQAETDERPQVPLTEKPNVATAPSNSLLENAFPLPVSGRTEKHGSALAAAPNEIKTAESSLSSGVGAARDDLKGVMARLGGLNGATSPSAGSIGTTTVEPASPPMAPTVQPAFWVASDSGKEKGYPTLEAACTAASDNATIEIRADGLLPEPQGPVRIDRKRLRIRPAAGFRPILEFKDVVTGPAPVSRWFTISGGSLDLSDCELVMRVPATRASDRWAVFSLERSQALTLRGVTLTLQNEERQQSAAFVEIAREQMLSFEKMTDSASATTTAIDVKESLLRGDCDVVASRVGDALAMNFGWSGIAVSGGLFRIDLMQRRSMMATEERSMSLQLDHVTAVLDQPIIAVTSDRARPPVVGVTADDSVIVLRRADRAVVALTGEEELDLWSTRFEWRGNGNYFQTSGPMWEITLTPGLPAARSVPFKDWGKSVTVSSGEQMLSASPFETADLWGAQRFSQVTAAAFTLRSQGSSVIDRFGRPAGVDVGRLGVRTPGT